MTKAKYLQMDPGKKYTLDNSTTPSNPGKITLNPFVWTKYNPVPVGILTALLLLSLVLATRVSLWFVLVFIFFLIINIFYWLRYKELFQADSNGGIVISTSPLLVAVSTDLTKFTGHYPVIKIIPYKSKSPVKVGDRIATVATYAGCPDDHKDYWDDFFPVPADYATTDQRQIETAIASYPDTQWNDINRGVAELPMPYKEGLYRVEQNTSDWQDNTNRKNDPAS